MRKIWLIRHAESQSNAGQPSETPDSIALTASGHRQAAQLVRSFPKAPDLIVVSPYLRTTETARPTMQRFPDSPTVEWPVHEFTFLAPNHYRGTTKEYRNVPARAFWERCEPDYCDGEGAESFNDFMGRVQDFLGRIRSRSEEFIAVFTHGYFIKAVLWECLYRGERASDFMVGYRGLHHHFPMLNGMIVPILAEADGSLFLGSPLQAEED
jgi:broad specificity phosphatase PhoE